MGSCAGEADTRGQEGPTAEGERDTEESRAQGTGTSRRTATQAGTGEGGVVRLFLLLEVGTLLSSLYL